MHHLYPSGKGDALCPLGFHPQVRWPTRCKRCFRDYKEHGGRKGGKDDIASSSPSLSSWQSQPQITQTSDRNSAENVSRRSWASSSNLFKDDNNTVAQIERRQPQNDTSNFYTNRPASWTSTPDLGMINDESQSNIPTFSITLPRKRPTTIAVTTDTGQRTVPDRTSEINNKTDVPKTRVRPKDTSLVRQHSAEKTDYPIRSRVQVKDVKELKSTDEPTNHDVQFLIQVKQKTFNQTNSHNGKQSSKDTGHISDDDVSSIAGTETTETTLVDRNEVPISELQEEMESLKRELETVKTRCEKAEREKSDILLRRLASYETTSSKTTASEVLKLQQKCNDLQTQLEDLKDDKKSLSLKVKELETELDNKPSYSSTIEELRTKLIAAETLCEELMDENEEMKKEMRDLEEEMEEMQDNFREDQADEYSSLKKELEQTTKNCRILSFKLRKSERKAEELEAAKTESEKKLQEISGGQSMLDNIEKIKRLEQDLKVANEVAIRLQKEVDEANVKLNKAVEEAASSNKLKVPGKEPLIKKKAPTLGSIGKVPSGEKVSRESLTRGGSQDDPAQLLRDLQDSLEREADLREQLRFAEEEAQNLRKKASRVEDDNESLVMQLKKMATKARGRKLSPSPTSRLIPDSSLENDEGISEDDDPSELKLLLELSEQEASVLRRKIEDMELESETMRRKLKDAQTKLNAKTTMKKQLPTIMDDNTNDLRDQKMKVLEDETTDLRKKLIEKERDCERLHAELTVTQKRSKGMVKSKSLDNDQQALDLKRQLQVVEQEAVVLQSKIQTLETDNEKLITENRKLLLSNGSRVKKVVHKETAEGETAEPKLTKKQLETQLAESTKKLNEITESETKQKTEIENLKQKLSTIETEKSKLNETIARMQSTAVDLQKSRTPKKVTDLTPKNTLKNMVIDLEKEIGDIMVSLKNAEDSKTKLEEELKNAGKDDKFGLEKEKMTKEINDLKKQIETLEKNLHDHKDKESKEKYKIDDINNELKKSKESIKKLEKENEENQKKLKKIETENTKLADEKKKEHKLLTEKDKKIEQLEKDLERSKKSEQEKSRIADQISEKNKEIQNTEKRVLELEEKMKKTEKLLSSKKDAITKLEKELEAEKQKLKQKENEWSVEKKALDVELKEQRAVSVSSGSKSAEELATVKSQLAEAKNNLENTLRDKTVMESKLAKLEEELRKDKTFWENKISDLESDLSMERKKMERIKSAQEKQQKNQQQELQSLKDKIKGLEAGSNISDVSKQATKELTTELSKTKQQYEDLTSKYELLEEEHVKIKQHLVMEKELVLSQLNTCETELRKLKDEREGWNRKYYDIQEELKSIQKKTNQNKDLDRSRMKSLETRLEEKTKELDQFKKEGEVLEDQFKNLRKENEDLKQKLDDFHRVSKVHRTINADNSALEKELGELKQKLNQADKSHRTDVSECKMRYESQIHAINDELQNLQNQVMRFKRERDMFKHMLEGAQKTIGDLKNASSKSGFSTPTSINSNDEMEENRTKMAALEQQISCLEDELSEARLESTKLKTELVSDRSSWEVKLSEMRSKINELEEDRLLSTGRTKIMGMRTRMELAWQKEREEQQRLLQETSTLARDLRQTLFEVERERDKERLEARRKQEQLKKTAEEEQEENRKKLNELQCDLLELRDAHAKLRTTNEKLRREKERNEKEKDELKTKLSSKKNGDQNEERRVTILLEQVEKLMKIIPESAETSRATTPTPPRRTRGSKSRESSPSQTGQSGQSSRRSIEREIQYSIQRLKQEMQDAKKQESSRPKIRRAASTEQDPQKLKEGLHRRSLSLEHGNSGFQSQDQSNIWRNMGESDSLSSLQSIDRLSTDNEPYYSMDSRLSGGSTQSELITNVEMKKKKKGLLGTLKKLTKSRSVEDQSGDNYRYQGSDSSMVTDDGGSKIDLKDRITGIFKRGGSSSRSNSLERKMQDTSSLQRPVKFSTAQSRPSPTPSDISITSRNSKLSRPSPTPSDTSISSRNAAIKAVPQSSRSTSSESGSKTASTFKTALNGKYKK